MRKVLYLIRRSSLDTAEALLPGPDPTAGDMAVTVILLEGAEVSPIQAQRTLKLVGNGKGTGETGRNVSAISYADLIGQVFESDTVVVL
ncbi:MAG: hypothetical protein KatS3mg082_0932 [Nitrospiraceae bacterium]|nr:MAG: hypothetical protein KatS3mg082_0932 [Nitrospiraceae bacterium]